METMPDYDPTHKAASISSITSTSSAETVPSLYSGADASESVFDADSPSLLPLDLPFGSGLDPSSVTPDPTADPPVIEDLFYPDTCAVRQNELKKSVSQGPVYLKKRDAHFTIPLARKRTASVAEEDETDTKNRTRDLLTEEERRANHIASEQKRRNTIRTGFKELTDIIPTLKNINNSKSTILFKAVEYIRHLEKRNRGLREKLGSLQLRLEVQGRMASLHSSRLSRTHARQPLFQADSYPIRGGEVTKHHLPAEAIAALVKHKNQQNQLAILREQLRIQQELLAKHNIPAPSPPSLPIYTSTPPRYTPYQVTETPYHHASAIVMPVHDDDDNWRRAVNAPSLNIPADDEFGAETERREHLLSLNNVRQ